MEGKKQSLDDGLIELDHTGVWRTDDGQRGVAHLLSITETDINAADEVSMAEGGIQDAGQAAKGYLGDMTEWILVVLVVLLVMESWLFHRHAVY